MHKQKCHMHSDAAASVCADEPSRWHESSSEARCPGVACCWHCKAAKHMAPWLCALRMQMESCQQNRRNSPHADNIAERQAVRGGIRSRGAFREQDRRGSMLWDGFWSESNGLIHTGNVHSLWCVGCILNILPAATWVIRFPQSTKPFLGFYICFICTQRHCTLYFQTVRVQGRWCRLHIHLSLFQL